MCRAPCIASSSLLAPRAAAAGSRAAAVRAEVGAELCRGEFRVPVKEKLFPAAQLPAPSSSWCPVTLFVLI